MQGSVNVPGVSYPELRKALRKKADKENSVFYIEGTGNTAGTWLGAHEGITEYYAGLSVMYKVPVAGATATTLNINGLGAVSVVTNATTAVSTKYPVGSVVLLTYTMDNGTAYWKAADYDADTKNSAGSGAKADTKLFLVGTTSQTSSGTTSYSNANCYIGNDNCLYSGGAKVMVESDVKTLIDNALASVSNAEEVAF